MSIGDAYRHRLLMASVDFVSAAIQRMVALGKTGADTLILIAAVDDPVGGPMCNILLPNEDWNKYRELGQIPVGRGLLGLDTMVDAFMAIGGPELAAKLQQAPEGNVNVLVIAGRGFAITHATLIPLAQGTSLAVADNSVN